MTYVRPSWDEYFMEISETVAKRATCDRGRSGCVIAKNEPPRPKGRGIL
jgi:dCMP deaminase